MGLIMFEMWIAVIVGVANAFILSYCARFWFQVWRKYDSPSAHAMTIGCVFVAVLAAVGAFGIFSRLLQNSSDMATISLFMSSVTFVYALIQLLFTRGYFNKGEVT